MTQVLRRPSKLRVSKGERKPSNTYRVRSTKRELTNQCSSATLQETSTQNLSNSLPNMAFSLRNSDPGGKQSKKLGISNKNSAKLNRKLRKSI